MKTISRTEWNKTPVDCKKFESDEHFILVPKFDDKGNVIRKGWQVESEWIPVKIKGVKKGEKY